VVIRIVLCALTISKRRRTAFLESVFGTDPLDGMKSDKEPDPLAMDSEK